VANSVPAWADPAGRVEGISGGRGGTQQPAPPHADLPAAGWAPASRGACSGARSGTQRCVHGAVWGRVTRVLWDFWGRISEQFSTCSEQRGRPRVSVSGSRPGWVWRGQFLLGASFHLPIAWKPFQSLF